MCVFGCLFWVDAFRWRLGLLGVIRGIFWVGWCVRTFVRGEWVCVEVCNAVVEVGELFWVSWGGWTFLMGG